MGAPGNHREPPRHNGTIGTFATIALEGTLFSLLFLGDFKMDNLYYEFGIVVYDAKGNQIASGGGVCQEQDILQHIVEFKGNEVFACGRVVFEIDWSTGNTLSKHIGDSNA
jgi:hypothetical protein